MNDEQQGGNGADSIVDRQIESADVPLWREPSAVLEWMRLRISLVHSGQALPRGDGAPVLLIPGFLCSDLPLRTMSRWLDRIGYDPYVSGLRINAGCLDSLGGAVIDRLEAVNGATGRPVHVIGHSLGGLLARCAAAVRPDLVASVVALGSPLQQIRSHRLVVATALGIGAVRRRLPGAQPGCLTPSCACTIVRAAPRFPAAVPFTSIYTRGDGIVDWETCLTGDPRCDVEVRGSHVGLLFNVDAYRAISAHLARASEPRRAVA